LQALSPNATTKIATRCALDLTLREEGSLPSTIGAFPTNWLDAARAYTLEPLHILRAPVY